ncbi:unnamed protein product [Spirodela intermedia]|uniref:Uncharacterized protein n=1 Tax=Spirodela intermedia TaxID=51605 RepID=A0A7I8J0I5_SPIIN|nr:unnamed protein product [Spirodela intermedia]CAA6663559.1 unnamed protein product [Spirodela intermedia]
MYGFSSVEKGDYDLESGGLYPGISHGENQLRWGFVRKVYGILAAQIVLTTCHPMNFVFLGLFTLCLSVTIGVACANTQGKIVLQALVITSVVVSSLTGYTFWAAKKGKDFSFLGPYYSLLLLCLFSQIFFPIGSTATAVVGGLGALIFSAYVVYDTDNLIKRFTYDEYIWASAILYLDILNLFLYILNLLRGLQSDG